MTSGVKSIPPTPLAQRLRMLREHACVDQRQMAEHVGTWASRISGWETGRHEPALGVLKRYGRAFGMTVSELLDGVA
jgi:transcriptional regulator with XRE-family HTH domain